MNNAQYEWFEKEAVNQEEALIGHWYLITDDIWQERVSDRKGKWLDWFVDLLADVYKQPRQEMERQVSVWLKSEWRVPDGQDFNVPEDTVADTAQGGDPEKSAKPRKTFDSNYSK